MTLRQWSARAGILPATYETMDGAVSVTISATNPDKRDLHNLSDYIVTSQVLSVVWLIPRHKPGV